MRVTDVNTEFEKITAYLKNEGHKVGGHVLVAQERGGLSTSLRFSENRFSRRPGRRGTRAATGSRPDLMPPVFSCVGVPETA